MRRGCGGSNHCGEELWALAVVGEGGGPLGSCVPMDSEPEMS